MQWPAVKKWENEADAIHLIAEALGETQLQIAFTPTGTEADAVVRRPDGKRVFTRPEVRTMTWLEFVDALRASKRGDADGLGVPYLSGQDDRLRKELWPLLSQLGASVPLFVKALATEPDASNFWAGDERAVSSCHHDPCVEGRRCC